mmetsp:Transcript_497/g.1973  ORF Transcript_497/g.1973 Transcript_497/m.1973 type:complete len:219 (+) Transcript_497:883-1539(+)
MALSRAPLRTPSQWTESSSGRPRAGRSSTPALARWPPTWCGIGRRPTRGSGMPLTSALGLASPARSTARTYSRSSWRPLGGLGTSPSCSALGHTLTSAAWRCRRTSWSAPPCPRLRSWSTSTRLCRTAGRIRSLRASTRLCPCSSSRTLEISTPTERWWSTWTLGCTTTTRSPRSRRRSSGRMSPSSSTPRSPPSSRERCRGCRRASGRQEARGGQWT